MLKLIGSSVVKVSTSSTLIERTGQCVKLKCSSLLFNNFKYSSKRTAHISTMECNINGQLYLNINQEYERTIKTLNTLQSNADTIRRSIAMNNKQMPLEDTLKYLERSGLRLEDVEAQSIIHVSGTKGKGSTCALTESILRAHGIRTGFFSSPHLVSVTERFRINGEPLPKIKFLRLFWKIYNQLLKFKEHPTDMPAYFKFLTILGFHIFLEEKVDVIILEVGIGGEFDCTNIIRNTKTVGISSLGLEHTQLLGNTLKEIAWQKAGIIKHNSNVFTSVTQPECLDVIRKRAFEKDATLYIVPPLSKYFPFDYEHENVLKNLNEVSKLNGSLAIQLANDWLRRNKIGFGNSSLPNETKLSEKVLCGLTNCSWPGRCHILKIFNFNLYLDGAHTVESMHIASKWYAKVTSKRTLPKILVFNTTGDRDSERLLRVIRSDNKFDLVCFVPNISSGCSTSHDNTSVFGFAEQIKRAKDHTNIWEALCANNSDNSDFQDTVQAFGSIMDCVQFMRAYYGLEREMDVLVTGSLHLIGTFLVGLSEYKTRIESD